MWSFLLFCFFHFPAFPTLKTFPSFQRTTFFSCLLNKFPLEVALFRISRKDQAKVLFSLGCISWEIKGNGGSRMCLSSLVASFWGLVLQSRTAVQWHVGYSFTAPVSNPLCVHFALIFPKRRPKCPRPPRIPQRQVACFLLILYPLPLAWAPRPGLVRHGPDGREFTWWKWQEPQLCAETMLGFKDKVAKGLEVTQRFTLSPPVKLRPQISSLSCSLLPKTFPFFLGKER